MLGISLMQFELFCLLLAVKHLSMSIRVLCSRKEIARNKIWRWHALFSKVFLPAIFADIQQCKKREMHGVVLRRVFRVFILCFRPVFFFSFFIPEILHFIIQKKHMIDLHSQNSFCFNFCVTIYLYKKLNHKN